MSTGLYCGFTGLFCQTVRMYRMRFAVNAVTGLFCGFTRLFVGLLGSFVGSQGWVVSRQGSFVGAQGSFAGLYVCTDRGSYGKTSACIIMTVSFKWRESTRRLQIQSIATP